MKKRLISASGLLVVCLSLALWWLHNDVYRQLHRPLDLLSDTALVIQPGQSLKSLAAELVARGWLPQPYYFIYEGRRQKVDKALKAGEYKVSVGTTPAQLLTLLVAGKVRQYSLTIPEGWTFWRIRQAVNNNHALIHTLDLVAEKPAQIMADLGYAGYFAEGRVFPDTYFFPAGTTDVAFLRRAILTQERVLQEEWQHRDGGLPYQSSYEALIMASIVEKETGVASERRRIAGVFVRRLQRKMKLQTDPTVIYALAQQFDGNIRRKDLSIDSPYNTYLYKGLPPTPIASPGRDAIHAALHPEAGSALYFVATGKGDHYFSDTLKQHSRAVARYQLKKR